MTAEWLTSRSPLTGETVGTVAVTAPGDVASVVAKSRAAFAEWGALSHAERKPYLRAFAKHVLRSMNRISDVIISETGKHRNDAHAELIGTLTALDFFTRKAAGLLQPKRAARWPFVMTKGWTEYHPLGVAGVISPWNYPFYLPMLSTMQALSAGCTVVLKPSEVTPMTGQLIKDLADEAGLPEDVILVIHGDAATGSALVAADTDIIAFTGSTEAGKKVAEIAAPMLKPTVLELSSNDAQIVLEDANIKDAAKGAVTFGCFNAGQMCVGVERVYVVDEIYDEFMAEAKKAIQKLSVGTEDRSDIGPMIWPPQADIIEDHVQDAVAAGARIIVGGKRVVTDHAIYFEPTLMENVDHSMDLMRDETFGPVVPVVRVADEAEAVRLANDTPYGLHGSVWTKNRRRGAAVAARMKTGTVAVNDHVINFVVPSIKFGGIGESGLNGQLGEEGIKAFTIHRSITVASFKPTTMLIRAWLPRTVRPGYWVGLARTLFSWRR